MLELTIPFDSPDSLQAAQIRKTYKVNYQQLQNDLEALDWTTDLTTLEIGALGHYLLTEFASFKKVFLCIKYL